MQKLIQNHSLKLLILTFFIGFLSESLSKALNLIPSDGTPSLENLPAFSLEHIEEVLQSSVSLSNLEETFSNYEVDEREIQREITDSVHQAIIQFEASGNTIDWTKELLGQPVQTLEESYVYSSGE